MTSINASYRKEWYINFLIHLKEGEYAMRDRGRKRKRELTKSTSPNKKTRISDDKGVSQLSPTGVDERKNPSMQSDSGTSPVNWNSICSDYKKIQIIRLCTNDFVSGNHFHEVIFAKAKPEADAENTMNEKRLLVISLSYNGGPINEDGKGVEVVEKDLKTFASSCTNEVTNTDVMALPIQNVGVISWKGENKYVDYAAIRNTQYLDDNLSDLIRESERMHIPLAIQHCDYDTENGQLFHDYSYDPRDQETRDKRHPWPYGKWSYIKLIMNPLISFGMLPAEKYFNSKDLQAVCSKRISMMKDKDKDKDQWDRKLLNTHLKLCERIVCDSKYAKSLIIQYKKLALKAISDRAKREKRWGTYPSEPGLLQSKALFLIGLNDSNVRFHGDDNYSKEGLGLLENAIQYYRKFHMDSCQIARKHGEIKKYEEILSEGGYMSYPMMENYINAQLDYLDNAEIGKKVEEDNYHKFRLNQNMMAIKAYRPSYVSIDRLDKIDIDGSKFSSQVLENARNQTNLHDENGRSIHFQSTKYAGQDMGDWFCENIGIQVPRSDRSYKFKYKVQPEKTKEEKKTVKPREKKTPSELVHYMGTPNNSRSAQLVIYNRPFCASELKDSQKGPVNLYSQIYFNVEDLINAENTKKMNAEKKVDAKNVFRARAQEMVKKIRSRSPSPAGRLKEALQTLT